MEKGIYQAMKRLEQMYKEKNKGNQEITKQLRDIYYFGMISVYEEIENTNQQATNIVDIYVEVEDYALPILRFVDKENNLIAIKKGPFILPSSEYMWGKIPEIESKRMNNYSMEKEKSLNFTRQQLKKISEKMNIPEEQILSIYEEDEITLESDDREQKEKQNEDEDIVKLKGQDEKNEGIENETKANMDAVTKQETSLDQLVNENKTLRDILNLPEDAKKLVFVETDSIANDTGKVNNTRFTPLYKDKKGNLHQIDELQMVGGNPNKGNVAEVDEEQDKVNYTSVNSMYKTKGTSGREYIFTANIGSHGVIDLGIGQVDRTKGINSMENEVTTVTTQLKTTSTYYTSRDTRERINGEKGVKPEARRNEANLHSKCEHEKNKEDVDGKINSEKGCNAKEEATNNSIESYSIKLTYRLMENIEENSLIRENYSFGELRGKVEKMIRENPKLLDSIENIDNSEKIIRESLNKELTDKEPVKTLWDKVKNPSA